jgi:hypothetical protein
VLVAEDLLVVALGAVVLDQIDPKFRRIGEVPHERLELGPAKVASAGQADI